MQDIGGVTSLIAPDHCVDPFAIYAVELIQTALSEKVSRTGIDEIHSDPGRAAPYVAGRRSCCVTGRLIAILLRGWPPDCNAAKWLAA